MATQTENPAILRDLTRELNRALDRLNTQLDRVAILIGALAAFSRPIPDYEPAFRHLDRLALSEHELGR